MRKRKGRRWSEGDEEEGKRWGEGDDGGGREGE